VDAQDVLSRMASRYAVLQSYSDVGEVTRTHHQSGLVTQTKFATFYREPSYFRFEFVRPHPYPPLQHTLTEHAIGFDGTKAYQIMRGYDGKVKTESVARLGLAVAGAAGISGGAARTIGRLLLPHLDGQPMVDLLGAEFNEKTAIDGVACYSIAAKLPARAGDYEIWIETDTLLLRKLISKYEASKWQETRAAIRVNEPMDTTLFAAALRDMAS
jgi:hypothetical protein